MTIDDLLEKITGMARAQEIDLDFDGSCPCFNAYFDTDRGTVSIEGRCWRISKDGPDPQDLYVWGTAAPTDLERIGIALKASLDEQQWYNPYVLRLEAPGWS